MNHVSAQPAKKFGHDLYVVYLRHIGDGGGTFGEEGCSHKFQNGIFSSGHLDDPSEACPALYPKDFHVLIVRARGLVVP